MSISPSSESLSCGPPKSLSPLSHSFKTSKTSSAPYRLNTGLCDEDRRWSAILTVTDTPPWSQSKPQICPSLTKYKKDSTNPEVYKQVFLEITSRHPKYVQVYTDGSKVDEKVAVAAVSSVAPNSPFSCRLRDHCSVYTAELQAVLFALKQVYWSKEKKFMIFSELLSALQALKNFKTDHPLLIQIQEVLHKINADKKEAIFMWVPGHIGIRGNEAAGRAAKEVLNTEPTAGLVLFPT